jgi:hypothetical protein
MIGFADGLITNVGSIIMNYSYNHYFHLQLKEDRLVLQFFCRLFINLYPDFFYYNCKYYFYFLPEFFLITIIKIIINQNYLLKKLVNIDHLFH